MKVFAPIDHHAYLSTAYGDEYMNPQGLRGYRSVYTVADAINHIAHWAKSGPVAGMMKSFHTLCGGYDAVCVSSYAAETLWMQMLAFVMKTAVKKELLFSLTCESLRCVEIRLYVLWPLFVILIEWNHTTDESTWA